MASQKRRVNGRTIGLESGAARQRWAQVEAARDQQWLGWLGRFRFVTAELMGLRFGVSVQKARKRLGRLTAADLVSVHRSSVGLKSVYVLAPRGAALVGYPRRRRDPRPEVHREHELAIVQFVAQLELAGGEGIQVLTERDARRLSAEGPQRYSVEVQDPNGALTDRWPDLVMIAPKATIAVEIEFAPKHTPRLARIIRGYLLSDLDEVRFLVASPTLARRLRAVAESERARLPLRHSEHATRVVIDAWSGATETDRAAIRSQAA
jgi:predicted ArsR family transcriptional regulator